MYLCKSHLLRTRWNEEMLSKNMFVGLFSIKVFQQTHLLPHALCTNPYISFQNRHGHGVSSKCTTVFPLELETGKLSPARERCQLLQHSFLSLHSFSVHVNSLASWSLCSKCVWEKTTLGYQGESFFSSSFCSRIWKRVQEKNHK